MKMIFLVDGDNNIGTGLQGIDLLTEEDTVLVFFGKGQRSEERRVGKECRSRWSPYH